MLALIAAFAVALATPDPGNVPRIDVTKIQPKELLPKRKLHVEYTVEINKRGQVTRVTDVRKSADPTFDAQTYGNALQAFIRTPDGRVVLGTYRLIYDYDPSTARVRRDVALIVRGHVNPNAESAVDDMLAKEHAHPHPMLNGNVVTPAPHPAPSVRIIKASPSK